MATNGQNLADRRRQEAQHRQRLEEADAAKRRNLTPVEKRKRILAGSAGYVAGLPVGVTREALNMSRDLTNSKIFYARLATPALDLLLSRPGERLTDQAGRAVVGGLRRMANPAKVVADVADVAADVAAQARRTAAGLNPFTGYAPTPEEQRARAYTAGVNGGQMAVKVGAAVEGGVQAKIARDLGYLGEIPTAQSYLDRGAPLKIAKHMADPYDHRGQGSHFVPQRTKLPKAFLDSPFNRTLPAPGATKGQMAEFHYKNDDRSHGGRVAQRHGGGGWSGARLGWTRNPLPARLWLNMPLPMKIAAASGLVGLASLAPQKDAAMKRK